MYITARKSMIFWTVDSLYTTSSLPIKICHVCVCEEISDYAVHYREFFDNPIIRFFPTTSYTLFLVSHIIKRFSLNPLLNHLNNRKNILKNRVAKFIRKKTLGIPSSRWGNSNKTNFKELGMQSQDWTWFWIRTNGGIV
jgi:hypothetical protein